MLPNEPQEPQAPIEGEEVDNFTPYSDDLAEVARQLNAQISDVLSDFGVDTLTESDPEWSDFKQTLDAAIRTGEGAKILRAAAKAGKAKAERLQYEASHMTGRQLLERSNRKYEAKTPEAPPSGEIKSARDYFKRVEYERRQAGR